MLLPRSPPDAAAAPPPRVPTIADPLNERELLLRPPDRPGQTDDFFLFHFTCGVRAAKNAIAAPLLWPSRCNAPASTCTCLRTRSR